MGTSTKNTLVVISFLASLIFIVAGLFPALSNDEEEAVSYTPPRGPLTVPVYPRGNQETPAGKSTDLRDSYIILEDGSVLTMADWVLGSLNKDKAGIGMSDFENRMFLGQVARAAVGMEENLVNRSLVHAKPTLAYKAVPAPKGMEKVALSLASLVVGAILPGTPEGYDPAKSGGAFSPTMRTGGGDITTLSDEWLNEAIMHTAGELKQSGTMQIMLSEHKKKLEQEDN